MLYAIVLRVRPVNAAGQGWVICHLSVVSVCPKLSDNQRSDPMEQPNLQISKKNATLRLQVEDKIREAISSGHFRPGEKLVERKLCESMGVGRTSVREALRQLEADGIITSVPHRGPTVSTISIDEARQLYELRALLEGYVGRQCAERATPEFTAKLSAAVDHFADVAMNTPTPQALLAAKGTYYELLLNESGNVFVKQTLMSMQMRINTLWTTSMSQPGRLPQSVAELRAIVDAIRSGNGDLAEERCRFHVEQAAHTAFKGLGP